MAHSLPHDFPESRQIAWHDASAIALEEAARMFDGKGVFAQCGDVIRAIAKAEWEKA